MSCILINRIPIFANEIKGFIKFKFFVALLKITSPIETHLFYPCMFKSSLSFLISFLFLQHLVSAQIVINEYSPSNTQTIQNGSHGFDDWIEIFNNGSSAVNLQGYGLTDDIASPYKFSFPSYSLVPASRVLVFASDKNNVTPIDHWETAVSAYSTWRYFVGTSNPDTNWRNLPFNDASWLSGPGGLGFGDTDDQTIIPQSPSVFVRKSFFISDTSQITAAVFNMDFDDGFVAFLNGVEIARQYVGVIGDRPINTVYATVSHEAVMYQGMSPDSFYIDPVFLKSIIRNGVNVLTVQVHNATSVSADLSCIPFLSFGMRNSGLTYSNPPSWFQQPPREYLSAMFKLKKSGETIYLFDNSSTLIDQHSYTVLQNDHSWARNPDGSANWCLTNIPTPNASNNSATCYTSYAPVPVFSLTPGFYPNAQSLTMSTTLSGGQIRYTVNGNDPTPTALLYSSPLALAITTSIRAKVFSNNTLPSATETKSYFIGDTIRLPVFTITTDSLNLWDYNTGIYVLGPNAESNSPYKGANFWQDWKKPATIEYYNKAKDLIFNFDANISIYGNYSRAKPQKSFEIGLKDKFGTSSLNYSFFPDKPYLNEISDFILRNSGTDWNKVHFRDAMMERIMKNTNTGYLATEPCVMYLNGVFWGVYTIHENHDENWMKNNYGLNSDEIDYLKESGSTIEVKKGSDNSFWTAYNYITTQTANTQQFYNYVDSTWDLKNYIDYFVAETYYNNGDWIGDWTNNIKMWRPSETGKKWRYLLYDTDFGLGLKGSVTDNRLSQAINPAAFSYSSQMFRSVLNNTTIKRNFINRYADLINTIYKPWYMINVMNEFRDSMVYDMPEHFAVWGSTMSNWQGFIDSMVSFINSRPGYARSYINDQFNLAGQVNLTLAASPVAAGRIQISTIVPDTLPWTGVYFNGNPVTVTAISNPGYTFDHWRSQHVINPNDTNRAATYNYNRNDNITAYFTGSTQPVQLVVSEINYNSASTTDAGDWIELHNYSNYDLDISGWKVKDENDFHVFTFPVSTIIRANGYLVLSEDLTKFRSQFPGVTNVIGELGFNFGNGDDQIRLYNNSDNLLMAFYYQDIAPWPVEAEGLGYTCERLSNTSDPSDGANWFAGCKGGSPGRAYSPVLAVSPLVNGSTTFCTGGNIALAVPHQLNYTYQWIYNSVNIPGATDTLYIGSNPGDYTLLISSQGCSAVSPPVTVTVVSQGADPIVPDVERCGVGSFSLIATATDSVYWYDAPGGNILAMGPVFTTPFLNASETYFARVSETCPSNYVPVNVIVNDIPVDPSVTNVIRCGPGVVNLNIQDTAIIRWYASPSGGALLNIGNSFTTPYLSTDATYYVETGSVCVSARVPVTAGVNSAPPPMISDMSRCGNGSVTFSAVSNLPVMWYDTLFGGSAIAFGSTFTTGTLTGSQTFYAETNNGCPSTRVLAEAILNPTPNAPVTVDDARCNDGSVQLTATADVQIFWYDSPVGGNLLETGSVFNTPSINSTTVYYAEAIDICSSSRTPATATIHQSPVVYLGNDTIFETGTFVTLNAGSGFANYLWSTGATTQQIVIGATDVYWVQVTDQFGCIGTDTIMATGVVGIQETSSLNLPVMIYPNPVNSLLTVRLQLEKITRMTITIMDVTGKELLNESNNFTPGENYHILDCSTLSMGIYFIRLQSGTESKTIGLIKE